MICQFHCGIGTVFILNLLRIKIFMVAMFMGLKGFVEYQSSSSLKRYIEFFITRVIQIHEA